jgi:hypothetical protein
MHHTQLILGLGLAFVGLGFASGIFSLNGGLNFLPLLQQLFNFAHGGLIASRTEKRRLNQARDRKKEHIQGSSTHFQLKFLVKKLPAL